MYDWVCVEYYGLLAVFRCQIFCWENFYYYEEREDLSFAAMLLRARRLSSAAQQTHRYVHLSYHLSF